MSAYIVRRILFAIPILVSVNVLTFLLFFFVNSPDNVARMVLGGKHVQPSDIYRWKREHDYHLPLFWNGRDRVALVSAEAGAPADLGATLSGYRMIEIPIPAAGVDAQKSLRSSITGLGGDVIFVVDPTGIAAQPLKQALAVIAERGLPIVVLEWEGSALRAERDPLAAYLPPSGLKGFADRLQASGMARFTETLFFKKAVRLFWFDFGKSDRENRDIGREILTRMWPSLMITVPAFILGLFIEIAVAMLIAFCRGRALDHVTLLLCVVLMSVPSLFYIFGCQLYFGTFLRLFPVSGYQEGLSAWRFVLMPVFIAVVAGLGSGVRFYRVIFLEVMCQDFVRTARAKGLAESAVLFRHVLKNAMLPILTNAVAAVPLLYTGSLILEYFFSIPGLGGFTIEGIHAEDFRIVGAMVYLGSFLYIVGLVLTDISYTIFDPRVSFEPGKSGF